MRAIKRYFDFTILATVVAGFIFVAAQRLGEVPVYETDESYMLQVCYEVLNRGKLALPMYRYLGGNIENVWHSLTPLYFVTLSAFLKVFGFGVLQGRAFNLLTAAATLLMLYLIGRRLLNWPVGLIAVVLMISDQTVLERSRLLRNDYAAEALALLAFLLYEVAEQRKASAFYIASGLASGAAVMCHPSALYMLGALCLIMLLRGGRLYQFAISALAVMAYEIIYDIADYRNFLLQYREDNLHFGVLSLWGWWYNLLDEPRRYIRWYNAYDVTFPNIPRTLLHLFQLLTAIAIFYLLIRCARRSNRMSDPRTHILVVTITSVAFFATITHKAGYYNVHLLTWFALCSSIMLVDAFCMVQLKSRERPRASFFYKAAVAIAVILAGAYGYLLARQNYRYLREVRNPDLASFEEIKQVLREIVPEGVCPVAVKAPVIWLAFPEKDQCFATIERRMSEAARIDGKDFALLVRPKSPDYWAHNLDETLHLIGELNDTPYGNFRVYYTGTNPRYLALTPKRYYFFRRWRGHATGEQLASAREVWSADANQLSNWQTNPEADSTKLEDLRAGALTNLCFIELKPATIYQAVLEVISPTDGELVIADESTGRWINQVTIGGASGTQRIEALLRTFGSGRIKLATRAIQISRISIREVAQV
jgi:hypothetical protein